MVAKCVSKHQRIRSRRPVDVRRIARRTAERPLELEHLLQHEADKQFIGQQTFQGRVTICVSNSGPIAARFASQ